MAVRVNRLPLRLLPDPNRVITRYFCPGDRLRAQDIIKRVLAYPDAQISVLLAEVERGFRAKHPDLTEILTDHFEQVRSDVPGDILSQP